MDVFEADKVVGGACRTEYPFAKAPALGQSTGAYLLGVMPPELLTQLQLDLPLVRRDPHYFLPTTGGHFFVVSCITSTLCICSSTLCTSSTTQAYPTPSDVVVKVLGTCCLAVMPMQPSSSFSSFSAEQIGTQINRCRCVLCRSLLDP